MASHLEKEFTADSADVPFYKADLAPMCFDRWHKVGADFGQIWAYRAVTDDPRLAIDMAKAAWVQRRTVRQDWHLVARAANILLMGRVRFDLRIEALHASPL